MQQKTVTTDILDIAYREYGAPDGWPCIMGHGFPYDVNAYAETAPILAQAGARVLRIACSNSRRSSKPP